MAALRPDGMRTGFSSFGAAIDVAAAVGEFYQAANPGRHADRGFGLGLVIVQRLCRAYGYRIEVDSVPSRGTRCSIRMPRVEQPHSEPAARGPEGQPALGPDLHVLLEDDDVMVRDAMTRILRQWGVNVDACTRSAEAFAMARRQGARWYCL